MPADLKFFKRMTVGKPVIMGRKTYEERRQPLPKRTNIVLTSDATYDAPGCLLAASPDQALRAAGDADEAMIIGGSYVYRAFLPRADRIYLTVIHGRFEGDTYFPGFDRTLWDASAEPHPADERNPHPYTFWTLTRRISLSA